MAFDISQLIGFVKKFKRWWDREISKQEYPVETPIPPSHHHHQQPNQHSWSGHSSGSIHLNQNQINSSNSHFVKLRNDAIEEGKLMKQKFDAAHRAYQSKDGALAKSLSNQGKIHQEKRNQLNKKAAEWIFKENNRNSGPDTIDLHGLYVQESMEYTGEFIERVRREGGEEELRIIVGKGLHSENFEAKLKPAIEKLVHENRLFIELDNSNSGVLIVHRNAPLNKIGFHPNLLKSLPHNRASPEDRCIIV